MPVRGSATCPSRAQCSTLARGAAACRLRLVRTLASGSAENNINSAPGAQQSQQGEGTSFTPLTLAQQQQQQRQRQQQQRLDAQRHERQQASDGGYSRVREQKDPSQFKDMDELRDYLHRRDSPSGTLTISRIIEFMGMANTGVDPSRGPTAGGQQSALQLFQAGLSRGLAKAYRDFVRVAGAAIRHRLNKGNAYEEEDESKWPVVAEDKYRQLEPLMGGLLSMRSLRKAAFKYPALLDMPPAELAVRMVQLKQLLGSCDVALLVEREPRLFLGQGQQEVVDSVQRGLGLMQTALLGANIALMIELDPALLFMPELDRGLKELRDLWDVDEDALADSDPQMLALAVRALSVTGLPEGI